MSIRIPKNQSFMMCVQICVSYPQCSHIHRGCELCANTGPDSIRYSRINTYSRVDLLCPLCSRAEYRAHESSTWATRLQQQSDQRVQATLIVDNRQSRLLREQKPQVRHGSEGRNGAFAQNIERSAFCQLLVNASVPRIPGPSPHVPCPSPLEPPIRPDALGPGSATLEDEMRRRNAAINAVTAYCKVEEGGSTSYATSTIVKVEEDRRPLVVVEPWHQAFNMAKLSVYQEKRPAICFLCLGNQNLPISKRIHSFSAPRDLTKYFRWKLLFNLKSGEGIKCSLCEISLQHKMHLQNHAMKIHGTVS